MIGLIAHQGGWDEILLFVAPLAIAFFAIAAFERRGRREMRDPQGGHDSARPEPAPHDEDR